jgi:hypothetical protein
MSYNDARWSAFWSRGSAINLPPDKDNLWTGKHTGEDAGNGADETVGYIVIDQGTRNPLDGMPIETNRGSSILVDYFGEQEQQYSFLETFDNIPKVAVLSQAGMKNGATTTTGGNGGGDGSWAVLAAIKSTQYMLVAVDEDAVTDDERSHGQEEADYIVFERAGVVQLGPPQLDADCGGG